MEVSVSFACLLKFELQVINAYAWHENCSKEISYTDHTKDRVKKGVFSLMEQEITMKIKDSWNQNLKNKFILLK